MQQAVVCDRRAGWADRRFLLGAALALAVFPRVAGAATLDARGRPAPAADTLAAVLRERKQRYGVAAICIGVGQGLAVVIENTEVA